MSQHTLLIVVLMSMIFGGCASLSKEECARANWDAIGYGDGSRGTSASQFNTHQKACAEHGFSADFTRYKAGHERGLEEVFCKPRSAYRLGLRGSGYNNVCPSYLEQDFLSAYYYGRDIHQQQRSYNSLNQQLTLLNQDIAALDQEITDLKFAIQQHGNHRRTDKTRELTHQRREIEQLYQRIEQTRPMATQTSKLDHHLRHELSEQHRRVQRYITRFSSKPDVQERERQAMRKLVKLAMEKGELESQLDWLNRNAKAARTRSQQTAILQRQLQQLAPKINRVKTELHRHRLTPDGKARLRHFMALAKYEGTLKHHREILTQQRDQYTLNLLIDVHFTAELVQLDQRIDFARHTTSPQSQQRSLKALYRDLHDAERQRDADLHQLDELERQLAEVQGQISHLKSNSPY